MKSATSTLSAPFVLKVAGYLLILISLVDYVALLVPPQFNDPKWIGSTLIQSVDRGIIPLLGLVFLYVASFLESGSFAPQARTPFLTGRFWAIVLSCLLGVGFLLAVPAHFMNTSKVADATIAQINQKSSQDEQALDVQVQQRLLQLQEQVKDKAQLDQQLKALTDAINSGQIKGDQLEQAKKEQQNLEKLKTDPNYLNTMAKEAKDQALMKIRNDRQKLEEQARSEATKTSLRTGINSLLLAIGYTIVGWLGLAEMGVFNKRSR